MNATFSSNASQANFFSESTVSGGYSNAIPISKRSFSLGWGLLLKQEKHWILGVFVIGLLITILYFTLLYHYNYKTEAEIFIKDVQRNAVVADYSTSSLVKTESGYSNPLFNYQQVLRSEMLASKIYPSLSKQFPEDFKQLKIKDLVDFNKSISKTIISSNIIPSTDIIKIVVKWPNAEHAEVVAAAIVKGFKETNLDLQKDVTLTQKEHLDTQLEDISKELSAVRTTIRNFKLNNGAIEIGSEGEGLVRVRVDLEQQLETIEGQIRFNRSRVAELKHLLSISSPKAAVQASSVGEDPYLTRSQGLLADLEDKRTQLRAKFTDDYPDVKALTDQIAQVNSDIAKRRTETLGAVTASNTKRGLYDKTSTALAYDLAKAQAELMSLQAQKSGIASGVGNLRSKAMLLPNKELGLKELSKKESSLLQAYEALKSKQIEANIKNESVIDNLLVLSSPGLATVDITGLALDLIGWLLLFSGLAVGSAWVKDAVANHWGSKEALETLTDLPVLSCIPWRNGLVSASGTGKVTLKSQNEWFKLAQQLKRLLQVNNAKVIGLFSTNNQKHVSSLMDTLAFAFTKNGQIPLILEPLLAAKNTEEASLQTHLLSLGSLEPLIEQVSAVIRQNPEQADNLIAQAIANWKNQLRQATLANTQFTGLTIAVAQTEEKIMPLFASKAFTKILEALASEVDCVLVNAPSTEAGDATLMAVAQTVDGALVYVSPKSKRPLLKHLLTDFEKLSCPVLGLLSRC
ncbi:MAG: hypothetical protein NTW61_08840 [Candidatus Melainabacteria bacterium]|jgi:uncharacterized protein involved in exopolysaccharide biosynthesis|nr:hypothetical protein [Candidatus Melainabacteria bacterium]